MNDKYPFGDKITKENYQAMRSLCLGISAKEFKKATNFGSGVHNRLRRFGTYGDYKQDERNRVEKYGGRYEKRAVTLNDIYEKLQAIEEKLAKVR